MGAKLLAIGLSILMISGTTHAQSAKPNNSASKTDQRVTGKLNELAIAMANEDAAATRKATILEDRD